MNFCPECGSQLDSDSRFCPNCGHEISEFTSSSMRSNNLPPTQYIPPRNQYIPPQTQVQYYKPQSSEGNLALIFGILGFCILPIIGNIIAIIFGAMARSKDPDSSTGKAGLILGVLGILCWIIFFGALFAMIFGMMRSYPYYYD